MLVKTNSYTFLIPSVCNSKQATNICTVKIVINEILA